MYGSLSVNRGDLRVEPFAEAGDHLITAFQMPNGAGSGQPDVYSNDSPGASVGCLPTTPGPRTSSTLPLPSVTTQWRVSSWTVSVLSLMIVTV